MKAVKCPGGLRTEKLLPLLSASISLRKGALEYPDMPREFLDRCRKKTDYLRELNRSLGRSTMNLASFWVKRFSGEQGRGHAAV